MLGSEFLNSAEAFEQILAKEKRSNGIKYDLKLYEILYNIFKCPGIKDEEVAMMRESWLLTFGFALFYILQSTLLNKW